MTQESMNSIIERLKNRLMESILTERMDNDTLQERIADLVAEYFKGKYISIEQRIKISEAIYSSLRGFGLLDMIMEDDRITKVMVNGPDHIYVEKNGEVFEIEEIFESKEQFAEVIRRIIRNAGPEAEKTAPYIETSLPDGSRVNIIFPPVSPAGPIMTIKKFSAELIGMDMLIQNGTITAEAAKVLEALVKAKYNIFISGGVGSGKTTLLNILANYIPKDERIITIEDHAELQIADASNLVCLETWKAISAGSSAMTFRDFVRASLQMHPDRIVAGEANGPEMLELLEAMNIGHDGSLTAGNSNSVKDALCRMELMALSGANGLPSASIRQQIGSAVDIIIQLSKIRNHCRRVMEISEVVGIDGQGEIIINPLYLFREDEKSSGGEIRGGLVRTGNEMAKRDKLRLAGYENILK